MRLPQAVLLGGVAALSLSGVARAETPHRHVLAVRLPDGQIEQIRYSGGIPPRVTLEPAAPQGTVMVMADPFAIMRQISEDMDRQADAMMRGMSTLATEPMSDMARPGFGPMTIAAGPGVCMRSVQVSYTGRGQPHVTSRSSGDCGPSAAQGAPVALPIPTPPAPAVTPRTIEARNKASARYARLIDTVGDPDR